MKFNPILEDLPISYVMDKPEFRNKAREELWGSPVFFFPSTNKYDELGCGGYYYSYGYNYNAKKGKKSNCTYTAGAFHHLRSGIIDRSIIGRAVDIFDKYKGRKDGGEFDNKYIGGTLQPGDWLIFSDDLQKSGDGHIVTVETVGNKFVVMEGAYSDKAIYEGKACIVYELNLNDMYTGKLIMLRPKMPFYEYLVGVCHTGDVYDKEEPIDVLEKINKLAKEIVDLSK